MTDPHHFEAETEDEAAYARATRPDPDCVGPECALPEVTFSTFVLSLASSALVQLGEVPDPESGRMSQDLLMAKHSIDILTMLEKKTRECLDVDERRLLTGLLYELRMKYVMKKR